jgi:hypothetical protein
MNRRSSRELAIRYERTNGPVNLYGHIWAEHNATDPDGRDARLRAALHEALQQRKELARDAGVVVDEIPANEIDEVLNRTLALPPLRFSPALEFAERALSLVDKDLFHDVAVMLCSTPGMLAATVIENATRAICVSNALLIGLFEGNKLIHLSNETRNPFKLFSYHRRLVGVADFITSGKCKPKNVNDSKVEFVASALQMVQALFIVLHEAGHIALHRRDGIRSDAGISVLANMNYGREEEDAADAYAIQALRSIPPSGEFELLKAPGLLLNAVFNFFALSSMFVPRELAKSAAHASPSERLERFCVAFDVPTDARKSMQRRLSAFRSVL